MIKFDTSASFSPDKGVDKSLQLIAVRTSVSTRLLITISNVSEVGFKKEWWQFWKW